MVVDNGEGGMVREGLQADVDGQHEKLKLCGRGKCRALVDWLSAGGR